MAGYGDVSNINLIRPAIKKYLYSNVQSGFRRIDVDEMAIAVYLPVAHFKKEVLAQYLLIVEKNIMDRDRTKQLVEHTNKVNRQKKELELSKNLRKEVDINAEFRF